MNNMTNNGLTRFNTGVNMSKEQSEYGGIRGRQISFQADIHCVTPNAVTLSNSQRFGNDKLVIRLSSDVKECQNEEDAGYMDNDLELISTTKHRKRLQQ